MVFYKQNILCMTYTVPQNCSYVKFVDIKGTIDNKP